MAILGAEVVQHGPAGLPQFPYGSFAGKSAQVGGGVVPMFSMLKARGFMAIRNQALTVNFLAWNTSTNGGQTGDSANFTLRLIGDGGVAGAPTNGITEPDSTNLPGVYEIALTAAEMNYDFVSLGGISSTSNVVIFPLFLTTESGDLAAIDSQLTVTDAVVDTIYSDTTILVSDSIIIESNSVVLDSSVAVIESQTTVIESNSIVIESQTTRIESDLDVLNPTEAITPAATLVDNIWDELITGGAHNTQNSAGRRLRELRESGFYTDGFIYIDTVNGAADSTDYEAGTEVNPTNSIANANAIATSLGLSKFKITPGSTITLAATQANQVFEGEGWTLALGNQNIAGSVFHGATVSGVGTGADPKFIDCQIGATTLAGSTLIGCALTNTLTMSAASDYYLDNCYSGVAGAGTPTIDFGAAVANSNLHMRHYSGGVQIDNKDGTGTDQMSLEGNGQLVVAASSSGAISVRGNFRVTNTGGATITYDDNTASITIIESDTVVIESSVQVVESQTTVIESNSIVIESNSIVLDSSVAVIEGWGLGSVASDTAAVESELIVVHSETTQLQSDSVVIESSVQVAESNTVVLESDSIIIESSVQAIETDVSGTFAEPGQATPAATASLSDKIGYLYKAWRNRSTQNATTYSLYNDDATTVDQTATVSDDGTTADKGEVTTGP